MYLLNRAVALSYCSGEKAALSALDGIEADLADYQPFHAAKADFLRRNGRIEAARSCYQRAVELSANESERQFLLSRMTLTDETP